MRNRIFRKKEYSLLEQVLISVADFNALAVSNYEGTEWLLTVKKQGRKHMEIIKVEHLSKNIKNVWLLMIFHFQFVKESCLLFLEKMAQESPRR